MFSPRNSVRVVLLIAQGWRGTSLPWAIKSGTPDGVRRPHEKRSLWAVCPFERNEIKKAQHRWRCVPRNTLTQGSLHYRLATLGYQKQNPYGVRLFS